MKIKLLCGLLLILVNVNARAQIITTYSINSSTIQKLNEVIDKDTIIFIELDEVLFMPKSKMFHYNDNPYRLFISDLISLGGEHSRYLIPVAKWYQMRKLVLVEDGWQSFINDLKAKNIPVYGFCTMPIQMNDIEQYRFAEAENLGIKFTDKVNDKNVLQLNKQGNWPSVFYHGIIFTGSFNKSQTLADFIKLTNLSPKKIVIFDKNKNELQRLERSPLIVSRIEFYNILYLGARQLLEQPDQAVVTLQQRTLLENGKWLEDEEAEELLKQKSEVKEEEREASR
jgi:hypothetical protein